MTNTRSKPQRSDGARNRDEILKAARRLFAEFGADVPLDQISQSAGVSRTTLYRNFATREELAATVYAESVDEIEQAAIELADEDAGVIGLFYLVIDMQQRNLALARLLSKADIEWFASLSARTEAAFAPLLQRAQRAGLVHETVLVEDIMLAFSAFGGALEDRQVPGRDLRADRIRDILHRGLFAR